MEDLVMIMSKDFFQNRRVLITGHTGFKGGWLTLWLHRLGANITGVSLAPESNPNLFTLSKIQDICTHHIADVRNVNAINRIIRESEPEIVFHLAAQPLVRASYCMPLDTISTNVMGSAVLLEALRDVDSVRSVVMVTTDKVYHNRESLLPYTEDDILGGHDLYSASKSASELIISGYRSSFLALKGIGVATARAGNVIGGGDWSNDRLIPDAVRAWQTGSILQVRCPDAIRPWQHVLEPLSGYLTLAEALYHQPELAGAYNFGPDAHSSSTVRKVIELAQNGYHSAKVNYCPINKGAHETRLLALDSSKTHAILGVYPRWSLMETVNRTMNWYIALQEGGLARELCENDIDVYESI